MMGVLCHCLKPCQPGPGKATEVFDKTLDMIDRKSNVKGDEANRWQLIATMTSMLTATIINDMLAHLSSYTPDFDFSISNGLGNRRNKKKIFIFESSVQRWNTLR